MYTKLELILSNIIHNIVLSHFDTSFTAPRVSSLSSLLVFNRPQNSFANSDWNINKAKL